jgi:glycosyltransferase involved in cell wall biosynthesis
MKVKNMARFIKVSIGMVVKNAEATIKEAIDSIIDQDFPHDLITVIVVDGYSKDRTLSIIKDRLNKANLKYKIFFEKQGLGQARQFVIENAEGDYVVWFDGDMTSSKDFISKQVKFMEQSPLVGIAKGKYEMIAAANLLSTLEIYSRATDKMSDFSQENTRSKALGTSGCIYRLKAIKQAGGFDPNIKGYGEDWDAEYRVRMAGWKLCTIPVPYKDYERLGITWKALWRKYVKRGYDLYDVFKKHKGVIKVYAMLPFVTFILWVFKSSRLYKLNQQKMVFLLPLQNFFKMIPWWLGYIHRFFESKV